MAIGMTYEQYWYDDPLMARAFFQADKLKRKRADEEAWLNGLYVLNALRASVGNMFRSKGQTQETYPEKPFTIANERKKREEEKSEQQKEQEALWAEAWMSSFVQAGKRWGKDK